jgi:hypothetical protein
MGYAFQRGSGRAVSSGSGILGGFRDGKREKLYTLNPKSLNCPLEKAGLLFL